MHGSRIVLECLVIVDSTSESVTVCVLRKMSMFVNVPVSATYVSSVPSNRIVTIRDIKLSTKCPKARSTSSPLDVQVQSEVVVGTLGQKIIGYQNIIIETIEKDDDTTDSDYYDNSKC